MIIIYTQPTCSQCKMIKMLMQKKHIDFKVCEDIDEMIKLNIIHTPTLEVDGKRMIGKEIYDWINKNGKEN